MPGRRVLVVSKAGSWEGWPGIRNLCAGWIGAYLGAKGGWLAPRGMSGFVSGMLGSSWGNNADKGLGWAAGGVQESLRKFSTALRSEVWEWLSGTGSR